MKLRDFFLITCAVALGSFVALIVWSLIVKNQVSADVAQAQAQNPLANLIL